MGLRSGQHAARRVRVAALVVAALLGTAAVATASTLDVKDTLDVENMTDAQQHAAITAGRAEFHGRYAASLDEFLASGQDPATLRRSEAMLYFMPPLDELSTAVSEAPLIVVGTARSVSFHATSTAPVTFDVEADAQGRRPRLRHDAAVRWSHAEPRLGDGQAGLRG